MRALKRRLNHKNPNVQLLALAVRRHSRLPLNETNLRKSPS